MRILGYIEHPILKITAFQMDNKLSLKFESGMYEQIYKFRSSADLSTLQDLQKLVDEDFVNEVLEKISEMHQTKNSALSRFLPQARADEFEEII